MTGRERRVQWLVENPQHWVMIDREPLIKAMVKAGVLSRKTYHRDVNIEALTRDAAQRIVLDKHRTA